MARQQKKTRPTASARKKRRWLWVPKLVLLMACVGLVLFIGAIFIMEEELHRMGLFGPEKGAATAPHQTLAQPAAEKGNGDAIEEVTQEERRELESILQQMKEK